MPTIQSHSLGGTYVSGCQPAIDRGTFTGCSEVPTVGGYVTMLSQPLAVGRYTDQSQQ
ncbi:hypothetical protein JOE66_003281 [Subtercola frigoramans]|uniref:Uncharacterized protein n=1 Tax=Subtercola frigoramans TaxID=120298 RepID=A0ABS2L997_9MICO|nr:hypothetical protein [Subtercola frigoramans]